MDEDLKQAMQAKWEANNAAANPTAGGSSPAAGGELATQDFHSNAADAAKAKQEADYETYKREMAARYAKSCNAMEPAEHVAAGPAASSAPQADDHPAAPKSPRTAGRELREEQDREFQEALAADQAAAGGQAPTASTAAAVPTYAASAAEAVSAGMMRDEVTGDIRPAQAQGRVQRFTDDPPGMGGMGGMGSMGMGFPAMGEFPGGGGGGRGAAPGARPELPQHLSQALSASQLELLYEAMGEVGGGGMMGMGMMGMGGPTGGMQSMPGGDMPMGGMPMPGRRAPPPFGGGGLDDDEGTPSNWDPRNARQTENEQDVHRRQVAELRGL